MNGKIPNYISIGGQTISVNFVERIEGDKLGEECMAESRIDIANGFAGRKQHGESMVQTFYHEVTHAILDMMGESELSGNEKFVSCFSSLLNEAMQNAYFSDPE